MWSKSQEPQIDLKRYLHLFFFKDKFFRVAAKLKAHIPSEVSVWAWLTFMEPFYLFLWLLFCVLKQISPATSVVEENAACSFCSEAPEISFPMTSHRHGGWGGEAWIYSFRWTFPLKDLFSSEPSSVLSDVRFSTRQSIQPVTDEAS